MNEGLSDQWHAHVFQVFYAIDPSANGESIPLHELSDACRQCDRILDENEPSELMVQLDPYNQMRIDRHTFLQWLLQDLMQRQQAAQAAADAQAFAQSFLNQPAIPSWEEVVDLNESPPTIYYYNVHTYESTWSLPLIIQRLRAFLPTFQPKQKVDDEDLLLKLELLFKKYDEDRSETLDLDELKDFCIAIGLETSQIPSLVMEINRFSHKPSEKCISYDSLYKYVVLNLPFRRRTHLAIPCSEWDQVEPLYRIENSTDPPLQFINRQFPHITRWNHPNMEQKLVALIQKAIPSTKFAVEKKVSMFYEVQISSNDQKPQESLKEWSDEVFSRVLMQLDHPIHPPACISMAKQAIQTRFGTHSNALDEETIKNWLITSWKKVENHGWEQLVDPTTQQLYYYHDTLGISQWDPPAIESQMETFLTKFDTRFQDETATTEDKIRKIFTHYDSDGSGAIVLSEFERFYRALFHGKPVERESIVQLFKVLDTSNDGLVDVEEFLVWWRSKMQMEQQEAAQLNAQQQQQKRYGICLDFLASANALDEETGRFEASWLPRLVELLGKYPLKGLVYRQAIDQLVNPETNECNLHEFIQWYQSFEDLEKEKEELALAKQKAKEALAQEEQDAKLRAKRLKLRKKAQWKPDHALESPVKQLTASQQLIEPSLKPMAPTAAQREEDAMVEEVSQLFQELDRDGSGLLDAEELAELTQQLGSPMEMNQVEQMLKIMDTSGDHQVSLEEFLVFWKAFQRKQRMTFTKPVVSLDDTKPIGPVRQKTTLLETSTKLSVGFDLLKDRAKKLTFADMRDAMSDWKDKYDDRKDAKQRKLVTQRTIKVVKHQAKTFVPTVKRRYAHLDVTWIPSEVVDCVRSMVIQISARYKHVSRPDAAQKIQSVVRRFLARQLILDMVTTRFQCHVDWPTKSLYFIDIGTSTFRFDRPVFASPTRVQRPYEYQDCRNKVERYQFRKQQAEMKKKQAFFYEFANPKREKRWKQRPFKAPAILFLYDVFAAVQTRMLSSIWDALREPDAILVQLIARKYRRQLQQRSSSAASELPLHYAIRHKMPLELIKSLVGGYPEACGLPDAYGLTPLHLAIRERCSWEVIRLVSRGNPNGWILQSHQCDVPLHLAVKYRLSIETMRLVLKQQPSRAFSTLNSHGRAAFHDAVIQYDGSAYTKTIILIFLKRNHAVLTVQTSHQETPLHVAMEQCAVLQRQHASSSILLWLLETLLERAPSSTMWQRRLPDQYLPVHVTMKHQFPQEFILALWERMVIDGRSDQQLMEATYLNASTNMTLLHYALRTIHTYTHVLQRIVTRMPCACLVATRPDNDYAMHVAAYYGVDHSILQQLLGISVKPVTERNRKQWLPLHCAIQSKEPAVENVRLLLQASTNKEQEYEIDALRQELRALVMTANQKHPNASIILALLEHADQQPATKKTMKRILQKEITPFYAISMRKCSSDINSNQVVSQLEGKYDPMASDDHDFLAMAKAQVRKRHHCPNAKWEFSQILRLMETHPDDATVVQRALLATNEKLAAMIEQADASVHATNKKKKKQALDDQVHCVILESITLNADLMLVRRVHQTMYEFAANARIQLMGRAILHKLLPTAFAKTTYKEKMDPYFNLEL